MDEKTEERKIPSSSSSSSTILDEKAEEKTPTEEFPLVIDLVRKLAGDVVAGIDLPEGTQFRLRIMRCSSSLITVGFY